MPKTGLELTTERMKARTFIKNYYATSGSMPTVNEVKAARALSQEEIAKLTFGEQVNALVMESEDREPSVIGGDTPEVGLSHPMLGEIVQANIEEIGSVEAPTVQ